MKKLLLFLITLFVFIGCSRDENSVTQNSKKGYYVQYNLNGIKQEDTEIQDPTDKNRWVILSGFSEDLSTAYGNSYYINFNMDMNFELNKYPLSVGQYIWDDTKSNNVLDLTDVSFYDEVTKDTYHYFGASDKKSLMSITITESTSSYVKGTFSGFIQCNVLTGAEKTFAISNGKFYLPLEKE